MLYEGSLKENKHHRDSDSLLIKRIRGGDINALREIVDKYKDVSFSLACSILKDENEAEDVLQDAFLKVLMNIGKFRFDSSFSTWLYRIVVNTCLNAKEKKNKFLIDKTSEIELKESEEKSGLEIVLEKERKVYITTTLKMMKPEEALLLRLFYLCDLNISEIRKVTDFSESNIKVMLHRGRKNMYAILSKLTGNEFNNLI
jgi:RNA polymerase sigma factor (sigma-70 family)